MPIATGLAFTARGPHLGKYGLARYTSGMTHKVGVKGQVVIPKAIRDEIGIQPGDEVTFEPDGSEVRVRRVEDDPAQLASDVKSLRGLWADTPGGGTDELLKERRRERKLEERKAKRQGVGRPR
jgi:antitoxin PrlF